MMEPRGLDGLLVIIFCAELQNTQVVFRDIGSIWCYCSIFIVKKQKWNVYIFPSFSWIVYR